MVKPAGREADNSPSKSTEIKIIGDIPPIPEWNTKDKFYITFPF
jgi:hypothetical protein